MIVCILILSLCLCACAQAQIQAPTYPEVPLPTQPQVTLPSESFPSWGSVDPVPFPPASEVSYEPESEDPVTALVQTMTLEEKVGQLFLARCPDEGAIQDLQTYHLGGYVLFGRDFAGQTPESLTATLAAYQAAASIPMLITVDEEGGTVTRVSSYRAFRASRFPSPRALYAQGGLSLLLNTEAEKCALLSALGIHANLAPVCDITTDSRSFMYSRSLGLAPDDTAQVISAMVSCMADNGIGSVLKHFPGYGNNTDTHTGIAIDRRPLEVLEHADLLPFAAGIEAGCSAIMVSHTFVTAFDSAFPASLSAPVHRYLRNAMSFRGVIVTDDLAMDAITDLYGPEEAAVLAVLAGNDLLCSSEYALQYPAVLEAVRSGRIPQTMLDSAVARILQWKLDLGLFKSN